MPLPGSWISATYLLNNKFKASIYLKKRWICLDKKRLFYFPYIKILLGHGNSGGLSVTLTCKVVVYHRIDRVIAFSPVVGIGTPHTLTLPFGSSGGYTLASGRGGGVRPKIHLHQKYINKILHIANILLYLTCLSCYCWSEAASAEDIGGLTDFLEQMQLADFLLIKCQDAERRT